MVKQYIFIIIWIDEICEDGMCFHVVPPELGTLSMTYQESKVYCAGEMFISLLE